MKYLYLLVGGLVCAILGSMSLAWNSVDFNVGWILAALFMYLVSAIQFVALFELIRGPRTCVCCGHKGFTFVEMMIVIVIIGITTMVVGAILSYKTHHNTQPEHPMNYRTISGSQKPVAPPERITILAKKDLEPNYTGYRDVYLVKVDGCEYIMSYFGNGHVVVVHKVDCPNIIHYWNRNPKIIQARLETAHQR